MTANVHKRLSVSRTCLDGLRVLGQGFPLFVRIAAFAAILVVTVGATVVSINWGVSAVRAEIDPKTIAATIDGRQFAVLGAGILLTALVLSYAAAAAIQATIETAAGNRLTLVQAISRVRSKGMQLFWLQWLVNILAVRFSAFAAPLLWLLLAPALPLAVLEDAGPSEAIERTFALLKGNLGRMLALEVIFLLPVVLMPFGLGILALPLGYVDLSGLPPIFGLLVAFPIMMILLLPVLLQVIALTLAYLDLSAAPDDLHAQANSNVS